METDVDPISRLEAIKSVIERSSENPVFDWMNYGRTAGSGYRNQAR